MCREHTFGTGTREINQGPLVKIFKVNLLMFLQIVGHPEPEKNSVGIFEYILASMFKVYLDVFEGG